MKRILCLFIVIMTITINADAQRGRRTFYYVVNGSYSSLAEAREYNRNCPDFQECWIYKARANGKTVYRMCEACFTSRSKAQAYIRELQSNSVYGARYANAWIWPSNGLAQCVEGPPDYSGERSSLPPLKPR